MSERGAAASGSHLDASPKPPGRRAVRVAAAVIERDGLVLACRRAPGLASEGRWEFPGGKIDPGEAPEVALRREIDEELGIEIAVGDLVDRTATRVGELVVDLACYRATLLGGPPVRSTDHDRLEWVAPEDLARFHWSAPDLPAVRLLGATR